MSKLRRLLAQEDGYTLIELLQVTVILGVVLSSLTAVFVSAMNSEVEMNKRFQAQQEARLAVDKMRREIHCASAVTPAGASASITITLPAQCPSAGGSQVDVVYDTQLVSTGRYRLRRAGVRVADFITASNVFNYTAPATGKLGSLRVDLPVNIKPSETGKTWRLVADIVLRNTTRL
jgi:prepilin-type N-terminal cleavage/methylation domain-containing protein